MVNYSFLFCCILAAGCFASKMADQPQVSVTDSTVSVTHSPQHPTPNVLQQNISSVEAVVDSIMLIDDQHYRASVLIRALLPPDNGFVSPGANHILTPQFVLTNSFTLDMTNKKNISLLSVRSLKRGNVFDGKISLNPQGSWILFEVFDH